MEVGLIFDIIYTFLHTFDGQVDQFKGRYDFFLFYWRFIFIMKLIIEIILVYDGYKKWFRSIDYFYF